MWPHSARKETFFATDRRSRSSCVTRVRTGNRSEFSSTAEMLERFNRVPLLTCRTSVLWRCRLRFSRGVSAYSLARARYDMAHQSVRTRRPNNTARLFRVRLCRERAGPFLAKVPARLAHVARPCHNDDDETTVEKETTTATIWPFATTATTTTHHTRNPRCEPLKSAGSATMATGAPWLGRLRATSMVSVL